MKNWITSFETDKYFCDEIGRVLVIEGDLIAGEHSNLLDELNVMFPQAMQAKRYLSLFQDQKEGLELYHKFSDTFNFDFPKLTGNEVSYSVAQYNLLDLFQSLSEVPENGIFLIDELGGGLHTNIQRKLLHFMLSERPDIQIICTAYSVSAWMEGFANCFVRLNEIKKQSKL